MAIQALTPQGKTYPQAPKGKHQVVLIGIVDRGMQPNTFEPNKPDQPKLSFHFETLAEDENGERFKISKWLTNSKFYSVANGKMSGLVQMLAEWLDVTPGEIGPNVFDDLESLCGLNATVRVIEKPKQDGSGNRSSISTFEPYEGEAILEPSEPVGLGTVFRGKTTQGFWDEVKGVAGLPAASKPSPAPVKRELDSRAVNGGESQNEVARRLASGEPQAPRKPRPAPPVALSEEGDDDGSDPFADE